MLIISLMFSRLSLLLRVAITPTFHTSHAPLRFDAAARAKMATRPADSDKAAMLTRQERHATLSGCFTPPTLLPC